MTRVDDIVGYWGLYKAYKMAWHRSWHKPSFKPLTRVDNSVGHYVIIAFTEFR